MNLDQTQGPEFCLRLSMNLSHVILTVLDACLNAFLIKEQII